MKKSFFLNWITFLKIISFIFVILFSFNALAKVEISPTKRHSWQESWTQVLSDEMSKDEYKSFMGLEVDTEDLKELGCVGYNRETDLEKRKDFWIVFLSALVRAESAFNPKAGSKAPKGGHGNYGLLQFSKRTARDQCDLKTMESIRDPLLHLPCGLKMLSWQLHGAPTKNGKFLRSDLKNQLFGKYIFLWGPLRQNDKRGRALLVGWFKKHLDQLPFCM